MQQCALERAKYALSASRSHALSMLAALRLNHQAAHRLSQQRQYSTIDMGACVITQKQMWSSWSKEELWRQSCPFSATSQFQSMTPHPGHSTSTCTVHARLSHAQLQEAAVPISWSQHVWA